MMHVAGFIVRITVQFSENPLGPLRSAPGDEGHNWSLLSLLLQAVFKFRNSPALMTFGALFRERFWPL